MSLTPPRKTTVAIEFCRRRRISQSGDHIIWLCGDSPESFNNSYLELGREARILGDNVQQEMGLKAVKQWVDRSASGNWLIVIDRFDEIDSLPEKFLPVNRGAILYTARERKIIGNLAYVVPGASADVDALSDAEGKEMFSKLLVLDAAAPAHSEDASELLHRLGKLPIEIEQAAAYIRETGIEITS